MKALERQAFIKKCLADDNYYDDPKGETLISLSSQRQKIFFALQGGLELAFVQGDPSRNLGKGCDGS